MRSKEQKAIAAFKMREWRHNNPDKAKASYERWRLNNPVKLQASLRKHREKCKVKRALQAKQWRKENPAKSKQSVQSWRTRNKESYLAWRRLHYRENINHRIGTLLRNRIRNVLKGRRKSANSIALLGCSMVNFKLYLESRFDSGMTWENYGKVWHIDHIMPCAIFDLTKPEHQRRCFHFSNLQPLFGRDNLRKNAKVLTNQFQLL